MRAYSLVGTVVLLGLGPAAQIGGAKIGPDQAERIALDTVKRAGGAVEGPAKAVRKGDGYWVSIGGGWRVGVSQATGTPTLVVDTAFGESPHAKHVLDAQPTSAEIDAAGREVVAKVLPDFDMAEMELESASVQPRSACAEARWRQVIAENGFHGPGMCWVVFCWPDRAVKSLSTRDSSIPR